MNKLFIPIILLLALNTAAGQSIAGLDTIQPPVIWENVYSKSIHHDSLSSSFVIFIKKEVKLHKHIEHTEQVLILDGEGIMRLGEKTFPVKKGDMILIPKNTPHALKVTSAQPVKVLSVQAPFFDGKDRIFLE